MEGINKNKKWNNTRWQNIALVILLLFNFFLHIAIITYPNEPVFDELYYVTDGQKIIDGEGTERVEHPPVGKLLISLGMLVRNDSIGYRMPAIILSTLMLLMFYDLCRRLGMKHRFAFLATMFLTFDNLAFVHAGMAMLDIYVEFFTILAFWLYIKRWWIPAAVAVGLAGLCKLSGVLSIIPIGLHWLFVEFKQSLKKLPEGKNYSMLQRLVIKYGDAAMFVASMCLAPIAFVLLMPVFDWIIWGHWINPVEQITNMGSMTKAIGFDAYIDPATGLYKAPIPSRPWEWLLSPTGSFYFYGWLVNSKKYTMCVLGYWGNPQWIGMINPSTWLAALASIPFGIWKWIKTKRSDVIFMICWIIGTWAIWIPISIITYRSSFIFYLLPTIGAFCMSAGLIAEQFMSKVVTSKAKSIRIINLIILIILVVGHMVSFCVMSPVKLWLSIPASVIIVALTLDQLGFNWKLGIKDTNDFIENEPVKQITEYDSILDMPDSEFDFDPDFDDDEDCVIEH